jgi:hypothetical protein
MNRDYAEALAELETGATMKPETRLANKMADLLLRLTKHFDGMGHHDAAVRAATSVLRMKNAKEELRAEASTWAG